MELDDSMDLRREQRHLWENDKLLFYIQTSSFAAANVIAFVKQGGDLNSKDHNGKTLLHHIAILPKCDWRAVKAILKANADVNATDLKGRTPLHHAVKYPDNNFRFISTILLYGANVNAKDHKGNTPLHVAARVKCEYDLINTLHDAGGNANTRNHDGCTPLHVAMFEANSPAIYDLFNCGPDVNIRDPNGSLPLHYLLKTNLITRNLFDKLLDREAMIDERDEYGNTSLHICVKKEPRQMAEYIETLLNMQADVCALDARGREPGRYIIEDEDAPSIVLKRMISTLKEIRFNRRGGTNLISLLSMPECNIPEIQCILETRYSIDKEDYQGQTPLHHAIKNPACTADIIKMLVVHGAPINVVDLKGNAPLHFAAQRVPLDFSIIETLLNAEARVSTRNRKGENPLHYILKNTSPNRAVKLACAKLLVKHAIIQNEYLSKGLCAVWDFAFPEATSYITRCLAERKKLKVLRVANGPNSFFDFVVAKDLVIAGDPQIFWTLASNCYPIFCEFIISKMEKEFLVEEISAIDLFIIDERSCPPKKIVLPQDCVRNLASVLSNVDILNLVIACIHV